MGEVAVLQQPHRAVAVLEPALTPTQMRDQVNAIQATMREVMVKDVHFGEIPGCGDKPALLKPGAEKICLLFGLALSLDVRQVDLPNSHREYTVIAKLTSRSGIVVAEGVGVCSTMESKYRYRSENTGAIVPKNYWDNRDQQLLGGPSFFPKKVKDRNGGRDTWFIFHKVEHDNPADYYNTVAKIAKKRAHVDATLTATAASDIFEQGEDNLEQAGEEREQRQQSGADAAKTRPGKVATAKAAAAAADADPEKRKKLIASLEAVAGEGMERLIKCWGEEFSEKDRQLVGPDFGRIKRIAEKADGGTHG